MIAAKLIGSGFFDSDQVARRLTAAKRRVFGKWGAFVRRDAKGSIRYRKATAKPGRPPSAHRVANFTRTSKAGVKTRRPSSPLRELIFFALDFSTDSVVAGPVAFDAKPGRAVVPRLLEEGGVSRRSEYRLGGGRWVGPTNPLVKGRLAGRPTRTRTATYQPHPFMRPAADRTNAKIVPEFRDSL